MRKIAWMCGFLCDITVLILVGGICYSTYLASLVESDTDPEMKPPVITLPPGLEPLVPEHQPQENNQWHQLVGDY